MRSIPLFLLAILISLTTIAQTFDENFKPEFTRPAKVSDAAYAADGKMLVSGYFQQFHGTKRGGIIRLNADGTVDETFNANGIGPKNTGGNNSSYFSYISQITVLPDNKILINGPFMWYNGKERAKIARLNADGSLDESFVPPALPEGGTSDNPSAVQADGKILYVTQRYDQAVGGTLITNIIRLNTDGSLDPSFTSPDIVGYIYTMKLQSTGKIIVTRNISSYPAGTLGGVFRLNTDGTVDNTFLAGKGTDNISTSIILPDDKIIFAGNFGMFNDVARRNIVKLNADGTLDNSFISADGYDTYSLMRRESSGTLIVAVGNSKLLRLSETGVILKTFTREATQRTDEGIVSALPTNDGGFLIFGYDIAGKYSFAKVTADFTHDNSFNAGIGPVDTSVAIRGIFAAPGGKLIIVGDFIYYNGLRKGGLVRLNPDLTVDETFNTGIGFTDPSNIWNAVVQSTGKLVLFTRSATINNQVLSQKIVRLNTDGSIDNLFVPDGSTGNVRPAVGKDDKIYIVGNDIDFAGANSTEIIRLNANGTIDNTFSPGYEDAIYWAIPLRSGKVIVRGGYTRSDNKEVLDFVQLNEDGTLDTSFDPKIDRDKSEIDKVMESADGKLVLGGDIYIKDADDKHYWDVRLLDNGDIDEEFFSYENFAGSASFDGVQLSDGTYFIRSANYDLVRLADDGYNAINDGPPLDTDDITFVQTDGSTVFIVQQEGLRPVARDYYVQRVTFEPLPPITAPTNLTGVASPTVITLTWTASANAMFYDLERWNGTDWVNVVIVDVNSLNPTTYGDGGLDQKTEYKYRVRARGLGGVSPYSEEAVITTTVGLEDDISNIISVYPNPAQADVHVKGVNGTVSILDSFGRKIADHETSADGTKIDLSALNAGIYFLKISSGDDVHVQKIVRN